MLKKTVINMVDYNKKKSGCSCTTTYIVNPYTETRIASLFYDGGYEFSLDTPRGKRQRNRKRLFARIFELKNNRDLILEHLEEINKISCPKCREKVERYLLLNGSLDALYHKCFKHSAIQSILDCLSNPAKNNHLHVFKNYFKSCRCIYYPKKGYLFFENAILFVPKTDRILIENAIEQHLQTKIF